ncbi:hypothetical protein DM02DRAFT_571248 [Periconia macrospinosa]|uniref:Uncharacterized protein n=1 Tax=Periconia macrospinosa TaxID=97972 RepID=A0A2V1DBJ3_9PLEO|nr:hypothetical protein DM02DRAFT_571248 [Periconia macrospinosa]
MSGKNEQGAINVHEKNVLNAPLQKHTSKRFCTATTPIAATLTPTFLTYASTHNIALPSTAQNPGDRACLSTTSWKSGSDGNDDGVPRVKLACTHRAALDDNGDGDGGVDLDTLKKWAVVDLERGWERPTERPSGRVR